MRTIEGREWYLVNVRYVMAFRDSLLDFERVLVKMLVGVYVPLV